MASSNTLPEGTDSIIAGAGVLGEDEDRDTARVGEDALTGAVAGNAGKGAADATPGSYGTSGTGGSTGAADPDPSAEDGDAFKQPGAYASGGTRSGSEPAAGRGGSDDRQRSDGEAPASIRQQANDKVQELRGQATDRARDYAEQGKARATDALDNVVRMISDAAAQVDDKVGSEYGDYARRAADMVGSLSNTLRDKDVDQLFDDARELVRRSPALAASAAAVVGFALVRVVKAGLEAQSRQGPQGGKTKSAGKTA